MRVNNIHKFAGKRIGVFGKGGSGKSTFVVLFAKALRSYDYPVCVLDADSTNEGLINAFGIKTPPMPLLDLYGGMVFSGGKVTCPVDDPTPLRAAAIHLDETFSPYYSRDSNGIAFMIAGKIARMGPGAGCDGPISKIARDLIVHSQSLDPILLIDFKAGFEDTARGAVTSLDWAFVVIDPTTASLKMAQDMKRMIQEIKADRLPATAHLDNPDLVTVANEIFTNASIKDLFFVLNQVPDSETENYLRRKLLEVEIAPLGCIHEDPSISVDWLKGQILRADLVAGEVQLILDRMMESINAGS